MPKVTAAADTRWTALQALAAGELLWLVVRGGSMAPGLGDGERVAVSAARRLLPGDRVAYADPAGRLVVHRLLGYRLWRGRAALVTRGDAGSQVDLPVPRERVIGRLAGRVPAGERLRASAAFGRWLAGRLAARWGRAG